MDADLALFTTVVEAGSMSAAARRLSMSAAMVSKRIARLEARLGVRLLDRTTRHLAPTPRGQRFYEDVAALIARLAEAEARVADRQAVPSGPLRVTAPTSFGRMHLAPSLKPFLDANPDVELTLDLSDGFRDIVRDRFDLAIRITSLHAPGLVAHRLADNDRVLCAAPAYLAEHDTPASVEALSRHRLLAAEGQMPWRLSGREGQIAFDAPSHVRTNSSEVVRELTLAGVGIALRSLWDVGDDLAAGRLVRILPAVRGSADAAVFAVHGRGRPSSATRALLAYLREIWAPGMGWQATVAP